jgi:tRNA A37 threonylcarbamoyladenosine biosynthesis protein TsaE
VLGSDVIYNEEAVDDLLATLNQLSGKHTTILLAGELRNGKASLSRSLFSFGMGSSD